MYIEIFILCFNFDDHISLQFQRINTYQVILPFLTSSSRSRTSVRLGSSESTNHIGEVEGYDSYEHIRVTTSANLQNCIQTLCPSTRLLKSEWIRWATCMIKRQHYHLSNQMNQTLQVLSSNERLCSAFISEKCVTELMRFHVNHVNIMFPSTS